MTCDTWYKTCDTPVYQSSNLGTLRLIDSIGLRVERPRPGQAVNGFLDILADPSPKLMPTSIQPCQTCVLGLFMCYSGWITAVPYMPSIQLWTDNRWFFKWNNAEILCLPYKVKKNIIPQITRKTNTNDRYSERFFYWVFIHGIKLILHVS